MNNVSSGPFFTGAILLYPVRDAQCNTNPGYAWGGGGGMVIGQIEPCNRLDLVEVNVSCVFIYKDIYMPFFFILE